MLTPEELTKAGDYVATAISVFETNLLRDISIRIRNVILDNYNIAEENAKMTNAIEKQLAIARENIPKRINKLVKEENEDKTALKNEIKNRLNLINLSFGIKIGGILTAIPLANMLYSFVSNNELRAKIIGQPVELTMQYSLRDVADSGVISPFGQHYKRFENIVLESAITKINKITTDEYLIKEHLTDLWEVSAHYGARNKGIGIINHESWQGKIYTMDQLKTVCGLGNGLGLLGWNCRHSFRPFTGKRLYTDKQLEKFKGKKISYKNKIFDGYQATQMKATMERRLRALRREQLVGLQVGDKIREQTRIYKEFCKVAEIESEIGRTYLNFKT